MSWEQEPHTVCRGGEACYTAFFKKMTQSKIHIDEEAYKNIIAKIILFKTIDAYFGKDGINLIGYKANMIAFTISVLATITNKALNLDKIWNEQCVISPSVYNELGGDMSSVYAKILTGNGNVTYKFKKQINNLVSLNFLHQKNIQVLIKDM